MCVARTKVQRTRCREQLDTIREREATDFELHLTPGATRGDESQHCRGPLGHQKGSVQIAAWGDMGAAPPSRSREPRIAVTKLKDTASAARARRSGLRGDCRLRVDTNLNTKSSSNMLRRKWLGRAPHKPQTTKTRPRDYKHRTESRPLRNPQLGQSSRQGKNHPVPLGRRDSDLQEGSRHQDGQLRRWGEPARYERSLAPESATVHENAWPPRAPRRTP